MRLGYSRPEEIEDRPMVARFFIRLDHEQLARPGLAVTAIGRPGAYRAGSALKLGRPGSVPWFNETMSVEQAQIGRVELGHKV